MAQINIYKDCTSDKPTKTYECKRLLLSVAMKASKVAEGMEGKEYAEIITKLGEVVRIVFPTITDEEIECIDIVELKSFFADIMAMAGGQLANAQKN